MRGVVRLLSYVLLGGFCLLLAGFVVFGAIVARYAPRATGVADGIVVLTGGKDRIAVGIALLENADGSRLLVSGAHPSTKLRDLSRSLVVKDPAVLRRIDLGYRAQDTLGNAHETRAWARKHGYTSLIVVTSSYHMPRAMLELSLSLGDVRLVPHPIQSANFRLATWWLHPQSLLLLAREYGKLLMLGVRIAASWPLGSGNVGDGRTIPGKS